MEENQTTPKPNGESKRTPSPLANDTKLPKFKPAKPGAKRQYPLELKQQLAARVKAGESVNDLAKTTGIHSTQIRRWSEGVSLLPFGGRRRRTSATARAVNKRAVNNKPAPTARAINNPEISQRLKDAMYFLDKAEKWMYGAIRSGELTKFDQAHDWTRAALTELRKLQK